MGLIIAIGNQLSEYWWVYVIVFFIVLMYVGRRMGQIVD